MNRNVALGAALGAAAATALLASCGSTTAAQPLPPGVEAVSGLQDVLTVCDSRGHRLYQDIQYKRGGLAVVPNDPSCKEGS